MVAFSLKGLLKRGDKAEPGQIEEGDEDLPFADDGQPEEVPESVAEAQSARGRSKSGLFERVQGVLGGAVGSLTKGGKGKRKTGGKKKTGKAGAEGDPFENPEILALIASEVAPLPPPEDIPEDEAAIRSPSVEADQARHASLAAPAGGEVESAGSGETPLAPAGEDDDDFLSDFVESHEDAADAEYRARKRRNAIMGAVAASLLVVAVGGGWWLMAGGEDDAVVAGGGLTVINEEGPAVQAPQSGKTISMAMPRPQTPPEGALTPPQETAGAETEAVASVTTGTAADTEQAADGTKAEPAPAPQPDQADAESVPSVGPTEPPGDAEVPARRLVLAEDEPAGSPLPPLKEPPLPSEPAETHAAPAFDRLPAPETPPQGLKEAPQPQVAQRTPQGILPVIGPDGETSWQAYARPFEGPADAPRVAIVVRGLGLEPEATEAAITRLPPAVTLSFSPYAPKLAEQVKKARAHGHEVMLDLPLEPEDFPTRDPGPMAMLTALPQVENIARLESVLGRAVGYTGLIGSGGAAFGGSRVHMRSILEQLAERGLLYVHTGPASGIAENRDLALPLVQTVTTVDERPFREAIDARLAYLEEVAGMRGAAVGVAHPYPVTFERLVRWIDGLTRKGIALAPVSAAVPRHTG